MLSNLAFPAILVVVVWAILRRLYNVGRRPRNYPPGPRTLPFIGNLHQIPTKNRHLLFTEWARQYGPIYSLMLGSKVMIVINSDVVVKDLIDKKGAIYSSRPEAYIAQNVLSGGLRVLFMPDDSVWNMIRKLGHRILNVSVARSYVPYQDLENKAMLLGLLETPDDFFEHLRRYTASLTTQMAFGFRAVTTQDPRFQEAFKIFDRSGELIASRTAALLDLVPMLRYLPEFLLPIKKEAARLHKQELKFFKALYFQAKDGLKDGTAKPSFSVDLINISKEQQLSDDLAAYIGGSLLQAGSETTANILIAFVQAMVIFPDVAKAAQAELDRVCGDRMPDLNDVPSLPYIRACAKESFRWMPGFMLGIPHSVTQDDAYMGYHIPAGSMVVINVWAIHNDPSRHPNPRQFDPLRYIDDHQTSLSAANNADATKRDHFAFGAGRRRCQGMHIADRSVFLALSRMLWAFDFQRAVDPTTKQDIVPDMNDLVDGMMAFPRPFLAKIRPRSMARAESVRQEWDQMTKLLDAEEQWKEYPEGLIWKDEQLFD